jgi:pseudouridine-5'-phosphate glycosidase
MPWRNNGVNGSRWMNLGIEPSRSRDSLMVIIVQEILQKRKEPKPTVTLEDSRVIHGLPKKKI